MASLVELLTVGDHPHIPDKTMYNLKGLCSGQFRLVLGESVKPLENRLGILLSEQLLDKFLCVPLCQVTYNTTVNRDSLGLPCLTSLVANANVERSSTNILTSISVIATVGVIFV